MYSRTSLLWTPLHGPKKCVLIREVSFKREVPLWCCVVLCCLMHVAHLSSKETAHQKRVPFCFCSRLLVSTSSTVLSETSCCRTSRLVLRVHAYMHAACLWRVLIVCKCLSVCLSICLSVCLFVSEGAPCLLPRDEAGLWLSKEPKEEAKEKGDSYFVGLTWLD